MTAAKSNALAKTMVDAGFLNSYSFFGATTPELMAKILPGRLDLADTQDLQNDMGLNFVAGVGSLKTDFSKVAGLDGDAKTITAKDIELASLTPVGNPLKPSPIDPTVQFLNVNPDLFNKIAKLDIPTSVDISEADLNKALSLEKNRFPDRVTSRTGKPLDVFNPDTTVAANLYLESINKTFGVKKSRNEAPDISTAPGFTLENWKTSKLTAIKYFVTNFDQYSALDGDAKTLSYDEIKKAADNGNSSAIILDNAINTDNTFKYDKTAKFTVDDLTNLIQGQKFASGSVEIELNNTLKYLAEKAKTDPEYGTIVGLEKKAKAGDRYAMFLYNHSELMRAMDVKDVISDNSADGTIGDKYKDYIDKTHQLQADASYQQMRDNVFLYSDMKDRLVNEKYNIPGLIADVPDPDKEAGGMISKETAQLFNGFVTQPNQTGFLLTLKAGGASNDI